MQSDGPVRVRLSNHAAEYAQKHGIAYSDLADAVLELHRQRRRNPGAGDWQIRGKGLVVVYNWPDAGDRSTAFVITVWRQQ